MFRYLSRPFVIFVGINSTDRTSKMNGTWENYFCSILADATPQQRTGYFRPWMGDEGVPLIKKLVSTGKMDFSDSIGKPASGNRVRVPPLNGFILQTFWDLLEIELKPKGNKLLSIIELWTCSKQSDKPLNKWLTNIYNLVEVCDYPEDSKNRIIRDALIIGCSSDKAKDKIVQQGEAITLNQVIEILQTEDAMIETLQGLRNPEPVQQIHYVSYEKKKKSRKFNDTSSTSSEQNSSSTRLCYHCREPYSKKHESQWKAKSARCEECQMIGQFKRCCKKLGNFPRDNSNQQNQSSSTGSGRMNMATAVPQLDAEFFNERGLPKVYNLPPAPQIGSMNILKKVPQNNAILISETGEEIQLIEQSNQPNNTPSVPGSVPPSDFSQIEFPLTEVVNQSQIDFYSITDMFQPRESSNSSKEAPPSTDLTLKNMDIWASDEEMRETRDLNISAKSPQSTRDSCTIPTSINSTLKKSISGTKIDMPIEEWYEISFNKKGKDVSVKPLKVL